MITLKKRTGPTIYCVIFFAVLFASNGYCKDIPSLSDCDKFFQDLGSKRFKFSILIKDPGKWLLKEFRRVSHIFIGEFIEKAGPEPGIEDMGGGSAPSQLVKYRVLETLFVIDPMNPKSLKLNVGNEIITREPVYNLKFPKDNMGKVERIELPEEIFFPGARIIVMMNSQRSIELPNGKVVKLPEFTNRTISLLGKGMKDDSENRLKVEFLLSCRKNFWSKRWGNP